MPTITKPNSKYSLLGSFTVTLLFVVLISKLISSVKKFCLMSADGTLLFPNLRTSGDTVCYQKFWEGGILKRSSPDPNSACFCRLAAGDTNQACPISTFHLSSLKITKVLSKQFCPCLKKHQQPQMKNQMQTDQRYSILDEALKPDFICTCKQKPLCSDKLLKCHNPFCQSGKFFICPS